MSPTRPPKKSVKLTMAKIKNLTQKQIDASQPQATEYELRDSKVTQLYYRVRPSGHKSWIVKYDDPITGKRRQKYTLSVPTNRLDDARKAAEKFFRDLAEGRDPANARKNLQRKSLTLAEAVELYKPLVQHLRTAPGKIREVSKLCQWRNIGKKSINEITRADIAAYIDDQIDAGNTRRTVNKKINELYGMLHKLYRADIISNDDVKLPTKPPKLKETDSKKNRRYFERDERARLLETAKTMQPAWLYPAVVISLNTGLRPGTLFRLKWSDIDFRTRTIHLRAEIMKTGDAWTIPYNNNVATILQSLDRPRNDDIILKQPDGTPIEIRQGCDGWSGPFAKLCQKAEIIGMTWYNMRHDFASQLVMAGVDLYTVKDLMCHRNITTTQIYAHLAPDLKSRAVSVLDNL